MTTKNNPFNELLKLARGRNYEDFIDSFPTVINKIGTSPKESAQNHLASFEEKKSKHLDGKISEFEYQKFLENLTMELTSVLVNSVSSSDYIRESSSVEVSDSADLEKIIGRNNLSSVAWLHKASEAKKSVCRVVTPNGKMGTGFIINGGYLITNNHVIKSRELAQGSFIDFNYELGPDHLPLPVSRYKLDPSIFKTNAALDYSLVKIADPNKDLHKWGELKINHSYTPEVGEPVNVIQHPNGKEKQIAITGNEVISNDWKHYLFYKADTQPGSSGSPVFNNNWEVIALHHAGRLKKDGGLQVNRWGKKVSANRGIRFEYIYKEIERFIKEVDPIDKESQSGKLRRKKIIYLMYDKDDWDQVAIMKKHMFSLLRNNVVSIIDMHEINNSSSNFSIQVEQDINISDYVFAIVTYNFLGSTYDYLEKAEKMDKIIIPILINSTYLDGTILGDRHPLPKNGKPVEEWDHPAKAYTHITQEVRNLVSG